MQKNSGGSEKSEVSNLGSLIVPLRHTGMCRIFFKEIPKHGSHFVWTNLQLVLKILMCFHGKIARNGYLLWEKSLDMGTVGTYLKKITPKHGYGFWATVAHLQPIQIWVPPSPVYVNPLHSMTHPKATIVKLASYITWVGLCKVTWEVMIGPVDRN